MFNKAKPQYLKTSSEKQLEDRFERAICFKTCTLDKNDCAFLWRKLEHLSHKSMEPCERFETFLLMTDKKKKETTKNDF